MKQLAHLTEKLAAADITENVGRFIYLGQSHNLKQGQPYRLRRSFCHVMFRKVGQVV